ncbi:CAP domain-containing protein [Sphaerisporangium fuscum]|uniref:CAP domain-containing protein n=1 Tax=Sphaerisporangium fuscum TaxID=2835868 RepID=UPI001BDCA33B|nr:CAP domain-containing protein [Sphaerisporangium fuscum]
MLSAAAVLAAAVSAGGVITLTGNTAGSGAGAVTRQSSERTAGGADQAGDATQAADSGDASSSGGQTDLGSGDSAAPGSSSGSGGSPGSSGSNGAGSEDVADESGSQAVPVSGTRNAKNKKQSAVDTEGQAGGPHPDGPAGYVEPNAQSPGRASGLGGGSYAPSGSRPSASPTPKASATARSTPKPGKSPVRATPSPSATGADAKLVTAEDEVVRLTNAARQEQGCSPLRIDEHLREAARGHSDDMAAKGYFDHNSQDGRSPWDRIKAAGYKSSMFAENIARGQATPEAVVKAWLNSPGHRENIMNCGLKAIGVGVHFGSGGPWWTQDFGAS